MFILQGNVRHHLQVRPEHLMCFDGGRKPMLTLGGQGHSTQKDPFLFVR